MLHWSILTLVPNFSTKYPHLTAQNWPKNLVILIFNTVSIRLEFCITSVIHAATYFLAGNCDIFVGIKLSYYFLIFNIIHNLTESCMCRVKCFGLSEQVFARHNIQLLCIAYKFELNGCTNAIIHIKIVFWRSITTVLVQMDLFKVDRVVKISLLLVVKPGSLKGTVHQKILFHELE